MAKAEKVNKSKAVRDYLEAHPGTANKEVAEALTKKGITIKADYVATIKANMKATQAQRKAAKAQAAAPEMATATAAIVSEKPAKPSDTLTLEHVKAVAKTMKDIGGFGPLNNLLGTIKEVGGVKKFKDLMEAMSVEPDDIRF
jgi:hypothetical protein